LYTPFDFNEIVSHKKDYCEDRLRQGSPVVGAAYDGGLMLLTVRRTQRKVYEIYDRHMFSAIGNQSDIETLRLSAINIAHQEGFERSPDDVTMHRLVGFTLSPALKRAFSEQLTIPLVVRALFAEIGRTQEGDGFYVLNYDGEFRQHTGSAAVAGTQAAEDQMLERLGTSTREMTRAEAARQSLAAWIVGARAALRSTRDRDRDGEDSLDSLRTIESAEADDAFLRDELKTAAVEIGVLERRANREARFQLLPEAEVARAVASFRS
jgi:proteasome alpha subunit